MQTHTLAHSHACTLTFLTHSFTQSLCNIHSLPHTFLSQTHTSTHSLPPPLNTASLRPFHITDPSLPTSHPFSLSDPTSVSLTPPNSLPQRITIPCLSLSQSRRTPLSLIVIASPTDLICLPRPLTHSVSITLSAHLSPSLSPQFPLSCWTFSSISLANVITSCLKCVTPNRTQYSS